MVCAWGRCEGAFRGEGGGERRNDGEKQESGRPLRRPRLKGQQVLIITELEREREMASQVDLRNS